MTENKYLTKVCALLRPFPKKAEKPSQNKYSAKISTSRKLKARLGEGIHRQHRPKKVK